MLRAAGSEPARGVRAQAAGAARDQSRAARPEGLPGFVGQWLAPQTPQQCSAVADRHLVLMVTGAQHGREAGDIDSPRHLGQVHQTSPPLRILQSEDQAEPPTAALHRVRHPVRTGRRDGVLGAEPDRDRLLPLPHGLHQRDVQHQAGGEAGVLRVGPLVEGEQRQHARHVGVPRQQLTDPLPVQIRAEHHLRHLGTALTKTGTDQPHDLTIRRPGRRHHQPTARQPHIGTNRCGHPVDVVAPGVQFGLLRPACPPHFERGQHLAQRRVLGEAQLIGESTRVTATHGGPELGIHRVLTDLAVNGLVRQPVAPALEGVRGQIDGVCAGSGVEAVPVDLDTVRPQPGQGRDGGRGFGAFAVQDGYGERVVGGLADRADQARVRTQFHETGDAEGGEVRDGVREAHGAAGLVSPVGPGELRHRLAREGGHDRYPRPGVFQFVRHLAECVQHRVHQRRVEGMADLEPPALALRQPRGHRLHSRPLTRQHHLTRRIHRRHRHTLHQQRSDLLHSGPHRPHRPTPGQRLHQPRTRRHQPTGIHQRQHTRHMRSRQLTHRVTDDLRHLGTALTKTGTDQPHDLTIHRPGRRHHQPTARQPHIGTNRCGHPVDVVAPGVQFGLLRPACPPHFERGQHLAQRRVLGEAQLTGESTRVTATHGGPELGIDRVLTDLAVNGLVRQPVAPALEGVRGQIDGVCAGSGVEAVPVDLDTVRPQPGQGRDGGRGFGAFAVQDGYGERVVGGLADRADQARVRTQFHETGDAEGGEVRDGVREAHGAAGLVSPVGPGELRHRLAREGGHDRYPRPGVFQFVRHLAECVQHRVHQRRVEGMADLEPPALALRQPRGHRLHSRPLTRQHHLTRRIHRRHRHTLHQQRSDLLHSGPHRPHRPTPGQRLHQPRTRRHQPTGIHQRQHTRHMRSRQLTHRVTDEVIRPDTPRLHQPEQRHLNREQRRLRPTRPTQHLPVREHHLPQRTVQQPVEARTHLIQRSREHREGRSQLPAHTEPLTTLTGKDERGQSVTGHSGHHVRRRPAGCEDAQALTQLVRVRAEHHSPVLQGGARRRQ